MTEIDDILKTRSEPPKTPPYLAQRIAAHSLSGKSNILAAILQNILRPVPLAACLVIVLVGAFYSVKNNSETGTTTAATTIAEDEFFAYYDDIYIHSDDWML